MTTRTATVYTNKTGSTDAGVHLGQQVRDALGDQIPDAVIVFASSSFEYGELLTALKTTCHPKLLVGASSAGEFTSADRGEGTACALALASPDIRVSAGLGRDVSQNRQAAASDVVAAFRGMEAHEYPYRAALVMTDALAGHTDDLVEQLTVLTSGKYQFAGGGAGDDARFTRTHVFHGTEAFSDAVVALELLSKKPLGIGVGHGWTPASKALRVTSAEGMKVISLNGLPAIEVFEEHAAQTGQTLDRAAPLPFFLHNIVGIDTGAGHRLRVPLSVDADGSVNCAAEIPAGARVHIMKTTAESAVDRREAGDRGRDQGAARPQTRRRAVLRLRRHTAADGGRLRIRGRRGVGDARRRRAGRLQHLRPDRTGGGAVRGLPQLHGRRDGAACLTWTTRRRSSRPWPTADGGRLPRGTWPGPLGRKRW